MATMRLAAMVVPLIVLPGCSGELSALDPAGPAAARVEVLWLILVWGAAAILTGVMGTALFALATAERERRFSTRRVLIGWGLAFPTVTLSALMVFAFVRGDQLLAREEDESTAIRAHGEQWRWRFAYPGGAQSTGVLHVPAGREFTVIVTSADVIHSFWVPRLGGKMDAIPGRRNALRLQADRPGVYLGQCSEYCGPGHAHMHFEVHAHPPDAYAAAMAAADDAALAPLPVLEQRPAPAARTIETWADRVLDMVGLR
ncbi:cytochrome c oxidase subunit II [Erythrobacter sp. WG]|uniref:cytochrome c oxidase subunit II n=1 Tax=Erythrobacter sp. WG TaxID=2985510 RepID=UPI00226E7503|nr:cytochrome c oxidase subunit II [Erythrobacter sp. WG]MCX9148002.1 cytochrome c oxidase subunit II [Erythrobacter sp. WG]